MKKVFLLFAALSLSYFGSAQTVENIRIEPDGENIKISYRIGGSTEAQLYNVFLTCSMDGGSRFEPKSVIGDVGENIRGGRSFYTVVWDVFEDVDEVGDVEFFVKVDLISDMAVTRSQNMDQEQVQTPVKKEDEPVKEEVKEVKEVNPGLPDYNYDAVKTKKEEVAWGAYLAYSGSTASPIGLSFGTLKKTGLYGSFRFGSAITEYQTDIWLTFTAGLTKSLYHSGIYSLYGYGGAGVTVEAYEGYLSDSSWTDSYLTIDAGIINAVGRLSLIVGLEFVRYVGTDLVFGIGIAF